MSNTTINLAEVVKTLQKLKMEAEEQTDEELYVFDKNGNKVLL